MSVEIPPLEELTLKTAGALLTRNVPVVAPETSAAAVRELLTRQRYDIASHVAVCDARRALLGVARIEDVLAADASRTAGELMDPDPPAFAAGTDQELIAWKAAHHEESAIAVVDAQGHFAGMIPPSRLLGVLLREHDEDMARFGGVLRHSAQARSASEEPVLRRLWHRLPWLLVGLAGAVAAADIVGAFDKRIEETVILAFFIPGIVYLADAVGTQTEALVIRGLSAGVRIRDVVARELLTGAIAGAILALAFFPIGWWRWGDADVALAVSLSLAAACSTATVVAMALPWLFDALGHDPAFGSGPLATVAQDLLSILIYLAIATALV